MSELRKRAIADLVDQGWKDADLVELFGVTDRTVRRIRAWSRDEADRLAASRRSAESNRVAESLAILARSRSSGLIRLTEAK